MIQFYMYKIIKRKEEKDEKKIDKYAFNYCNAYEFFNRLCGNGITDTN